MNHTPHRHDLAVQQFDYARQVLLQHLRWLPAELRNEEIAATISALQQLAVLEK